MSTADARLAERDRRIREYARQVVADAGPMTPEERAEVVTLMRSVRGIVPQVSRGAA